MLRGKIEGLQVIQAMVGHVVIMWRNVSDSEGICPALN